MPAKKKSPQASKYLLSEVDALQYSELQAENKRCRIKASGLGTRTLTKKVSKNGPESYCFSAGRGDCSDTVPHHFPIPYGHKANRFLVPSFYDRGY